MALEGGLDTVETRMLPISKIEPRIGQPRTNFDEEAIQELSESIAQHGLLQPLTVRPIDNGYYQIIAGERRWRASRLAGLYEVPARIIEVDDMKAQELALVENLQREDLNPIEAARGYKVLLDNFGMSLENIAASMGKSRPAISNSLRLLALPSEIIQMVETGTLTSGHARALLHIKDAVNMLKAAEQVIDQDLTVRETEMLAYSIEKGKARVPKVKPKPDIDYAAIASRDLGDVLGRKVKIVAGKKKGRIEIEFYDADDRENLITTLKLLRLLRRNS